MLGSAIGEFPMRVRACDGTAPLLPPREGCDRDARWIMPTRPRRPARELMRPMAVGAREKRRVLRGRFTPLSGPAAAMPV